MSPIEKTVRVGKPEDQDRWRREDMLRMTPNERLQMLLDWRDDCFRGTQTIQRIAKCKAVPWKSPRS